MGASEVTLTDLPYVLPLMQGNVERHRDMIQESGCYKIECKACDWFAPAKFMEEYYGRHGQPDKEHVILLADCVWVQELVSPLLATIKLLITREPSSVVIISYQRRGKPAHEEFFAGLDEIFGTVRDIDVVSLGMSKPESLQLLECHVSTTLQT